MNQKYLLTCLLLSTVLASGCIGGGGGDGGGLNIGPGGKTVTVTSFKVQPKSILAGSSTQMHVGIVNTGVMPANVSVGDKGTKILRNYCPDIFNIQSFSGYSSRVSSTEDSYTLKPGGELQLRWTLKNSNKGSVPTYGYKCPLSMQIPFDYGVSAYQQLEVKRDRDVQGATELQSRTSQGPMTINLEMIGSTSKKGAPTFIKGDRMEVLVQMENNAPEESSYQGLVSLKEPVIGTSDRFKINKSSCNMKTKTAGSATGAAYMKSGGSRFKGAEITSGSGTNSNSESSSGGLVDSIVVNQKMRIYQGESRIIRCGVVLTPKNGDEKLKSKMGVPSIRGQIDAHVNYTYIKDLGETQIKVKYRG
ncbi:MAG: hypothetical protein ABEJ87_05970 [Candidatus Nanohalobium sp.]